MSPSAAHLVKRSELRAAAEYFHEESNGNISNIRCLHLVRYGAGGGADVDGGVAAARF